MPPKRSIPIQHLKDNHSALEELSRSLDRVFPHIKCWLHLAEEMNIDSQVISQFRLYSENSPTVKLFEFLKATRPQMSVKDLKNALIKIRRIDIQEMIVKTCKDKDNISEVITDSSNDILDKMAEELDSARKPMGDWKKLAQVLDVPRAYYQKFEMYSDYNPTVALVRYLYATREEPILLKEFMDCFDKMKREDVFDKVKQSIKEENMMSMNANEVLKVGSDLLNEIAVLLNKDIPNVGGWKELASHFNVDPSITDSLEPTRDSEVHSPTTKVINWLATTRPTTTVNDVAKALQKIQHNHALKILRSYFDVEVSYDESILEEVDIPADLDRTHRDENVDRRCPTPVSEAHFSIQATEEKKTEVDKHDFGLPSKTIELIGRVKEKKELMESLTNNFYRMVVLHGPTGCGKTTLVVNVAHDIIQDPHGYSVVYVDSKDVLSCRDLADKILTTHGIASSGNSSKSQVIELFSQSKENCVLILENLDYMYHSIDKLNETFATTTNQAGSSCEEFPWAKGTESSKKEEFQHFVKDLAKSAPKLTIIVTTWEAVALIGINVKQMRLSLLSDEESLELLRSRLIDKPIRPEDQEAINTIIQCSGGIPLLLSTAVVVINELGSVGAGGKILSSSPPGKQVEILSPKSLPEEERLDYCLGHCFQRMNECSRKILVLLSVFPNSFTMKEVQHIIKGSKIDEEQLEEGFQSLRKFSFLNVYDEKSEKYILHPAVRYFGILKSRQEEEEIDKEKETLKSVFEAARWRYIFYTFSILSEIEEEFFSTQSMSAIQKFKLQDENIREIARWCITERRMDVKVKKFCIQSFIDSQSVLLKLMRSHLLKLILCKFCQLCQEDKKLAELYCECLILGGAKIVIGCLCTPYMCSTALNEAMWCFLKAYKSLKTKSSEASKERISDLISFDVPRVIMESDAISDQAKARFLIKGGKCLVRYGHKKVGLDFIQNGIKIHSQCCKNSPSCGKHHVMLAAAYNDLAAAYTYVRQHTDAVLLRKKRVLPIYVKQLGMHPFTATAHSQLARNYLELGDYDKAVKVNDIALKYRQALLGDHQDTARSLFDKGDILSQQAFMSHSGPITEKYEEALKYFEEALQMQQQVLDSPEETLKTLQEVVVVLNALGRSDEVKKRQEQMSEYVKKIKANYHQGHI